MTAEVARKIAILNRHDALLEKSPLVPPPPEPEAKKRSTPRVPPRWLRIPEAVQYCNINRSRIFALIADGSIVSAAVKHSKTAKRGIRLIDRLSLDQYLERLCIPQEQQLAAEASALAKEQEAIKAEAAEVARKQKQVQKDLTAVRRRRHGILS
jgi:hypothetical protein